VSKRFLTQLAFYIVNALVHALGDAQQIINWRKRSAAEFRQELRELETEE